MKRVVLGGDELRDFTSLGFDDHIKLYFPEGMRDFTPRRYDEHTNELWIDFVLHDHGPATEWVKSAVAGQSLEIGGPKGSAVIALEGIDSHVFIGDETALPAIGRRLAELPATTQALAIAEVNANETWPEFECAADLTTRWVSRRDVASAPGAAIIDLLRTEQFPSGRCFVWVACESNAARALRRYLADERGIDRKWIKAAGYWRRDGAGSLERIDDD